MTSLFLLKSGVARASGMRWPEAKDGMAHPIIYRKFPLKGIKSSLSKYMCQKRHIFSYTGVTTPQSVGASPQFRIFAKPCMFAVLCTKRRKAASDGHFQYVNSCTYKSFKLARCMLSIYVDRITETQAKELKMRDLVETRWNPITRILKVTRNGNRPAFFRTTVIMANFNIRTFDLRQGQIHQIMNEIGQSNVGRM